MTPGVVCIKHMPHGFFEPQIQQYFAQFGDISKVRVVRSKKSGRSKGYGYVQFRSAAVAKVVADTMNNYLMFEKLLKCEFIPMDKLHKHTFKNYGQRFTPSKFPQIHASRVNSRKTDEKLSKLNSKMLARLKKKNEKLKAMGIEYTFSALDAGVKTEVKAEEDIELVDIKPDSSDLDGGASLMDSSHLSTRSIISTIPSSTPGGIADTSGLMSTSANSSLLSVSVDSSEDEITVKGLDDAKMRSKIHVKRKRKHTVPLNPVEVKEEDNTDDDCTPNMKKKNSRPRGGGAPTRKSKRNVS